jgi:hypothetical protein
MGLCTLSVDLNPTDKHSLEGSDVWALVRKWMEKDGRSLLSPAWNTLQSSLPPLGLLARYRFRVQSHPKQKHELPVHSSRNTSWFGGPEGKN